MPRPDYGEQRDPAKNRNIEGHLEATTLRHFFGAQGLDFAVLRLTFTSPRKARAVYVDKRAKTMEWFRQMQSRGQMHVRRLDHAVKRNLRKNALKRHYADL